MVVEVEVHVVVSYNAEAVAVHVEHHRIEIEPAVVDHYFNVHVVDHVSLFVFEEHPFGHGAERFGVEQHKAVARELQSHVECFEADVHQRVQIGCQRKFCIHYALHGVEHRHNGIDLRHHAENLVEIELGYVHAGGERDVVACGCGVEGCQLHGAHVGECLQPVERQGPVVDVDIAVEVVEPHVTVVDMTGFHAQFGIDV